MPDTQLSAMNKLAKAIVSKRKKRPVRFGKRRKERGERSRVQRNQDFIGQALGRANGNKRRRYL